MPDEQSPSRREFLKTGARAAGVAAFAGAIGWSAKGQAGERTVWQVDPLKCIQCGRCATNCVMTPSAAKCMHAYELCGYCDLCTGFLEANCTAQNTAAENQLCPTGAIRRRFTNEDPYYEYTIDEALCVGCGKCVKGCSAYGNGSLFLQIRHDRCVNCNECSIARACPSRAISRVPASSPYLVKKRPGKT
jgi:electron transport complex protein RnfB